MNRQGSFFALVAGLSVLDEFSGVKSLSFPQFSEGTPPWHNYHVPKEMRKGKTPEEIDKLRKEMWETAFTEREKERE
jgi:hypothetical protein